jgi:hypothetical protein
MLVRDSANRMSKPQRDEMRRRAVLFLHYFIRNPFYEACSRYTAHIAHSFHTSFFIAFFSCQSSTVINVTLAQFEQRLPGMSYLTGLLAF